ncbi:hypothetical protein J6590_089828 [Homalodisca vitripennis]|nr:hypothetical protein J6590_004663 [Homalodisca vitripennis]KAG8314583.1 hypothetical protein J6590_089828 [Homalodisca vitripennis]
MSSAYPNLENNIMLDETPARRDGQATSYLGPPDPARVIFDKTCYQLIVGRQRVWVTAAAYDNYNNHKVILCLRQHSNTIRGEATGVASTTRTSNEEM